MVPVGVSAVDLAGRFGGLWARLGAGGDWTPAFDAVMRGWQEPHRRYHGVDHLRDCLLQLDGSPSDGDAGDLAEAALWYHDAVYRPGAPDNESRSAELARVTLIAAGTGRETADEVARLVLLTDHAIPAPDPVGALVCDVDLSILGRAPEVFGEYERRIRDEYRQVPETTYRRERARVLAAFLERRPLYLTGHFRERYEAGARHNLRHSLALLRADLA